MMMTHTHTRTQTDLKPPNPQVEGFERLSWKQLRHERLRAAPRVDLLDAGDGADVASGV